MYRKIGAISGHLEEGDEHEEEHHDDEEEEEHHEEEGQSGTLSEWGLSSSLLYQWNDDWQTGLGVSWTQGIDEAGIDERLRISPMVRWQITETTGVRLQYNYDHLSGHGDEHSVRLGFSFDWAGSEVR